MSQQHPLLIVDNQDLLDDLVRLATSGGVEVQVAADPGAAREAWANAPLVVAQATMSAALRAARLPRRADVVLVADDPSDPAVWELAQDMGADHVVFLPAAERWLVDRFARCSDDAAAPGPLVAVIGGRGGAGASVLAAALCVTAARAGRRAVLVDADPLGAGLDLVLGGEDAPGLRWADLVRASGRLAGEALCAALPEIGGVRLLSWDRDDSVALSADAVTAVLPALRRGADLVVADLPRCLDPPAVQALREAALSLLVVPAEVRACTAAGRVAASVLPHCADLRVVVRGPAPARLSSRDVSRALHLPLAGVLRPEPGLAAGLERGDRPGGRGRTPLARFCSSLLDRLPEPRRTAGA